MPDPSTPAPSVPGDHRSGDDAGAADVDPARAPSVDALRRAISEQTPLLTGPTLHDSVTVRVRRALTSASELLDLLDRHGGLPDGDAPSVPRSPDLARDTVARTVAWLMESVGAYQRLPRSFAHGHVVRAEHAPLLALVDELDLLGLTLDHAYDAAHRDDPDHARSQHAVLLERFPTTVRPDAVVDETGIGSEHLDDRVVREEGLEVGEDGIPRLPVPEQPDPHHDRAGAPAAKDSQTQEDE